VLIEPSGLEFSVAEKEPLLRSGLRAGLPMPHDCCTGNCGTCKFQLLEGEVLQLWPEAPAQNARDIARGRFLACQTTVTTDARIEALGWPGELVPNRPARMEAVLTTRQRLTKSMSRFSFRTEQPAVFLPGQFALIAFPEVEGERAFSMSNVPNEDGRWEFIVRRGNGPGTAALFDMPVGGRVHIDGPLGKAFLRETDRPILCIAGGSGLAPIMSIMRWLAQSKRGGITDLFIGVRSPDELCLLDEIEGWQENSSTKANFVISEGNGIDWGGDVGFVHQFLASRCRRPLSDYEVYLAGPPPMIDAVTAVLRDNDVPTQDVHFDRFY
jgi:toluene monooxygenase electron transfer component